MLIDYSLLKEKTLDDRIDTLTGESLRVLDYINTLHEAKSKEMMSVEELQDRIKKMFLGLDKDWFFDQQLEKYKAIKSKFLQITYNEDSKLRKHLTGINKLEEAANAVRKILS